MRRSGSLASAAWTIKSSTGSGSAGTGADHDRHWVGYHVRRLCRLCRLAKVPVVWPHGFRGTQSCIAAHAVPVEHVAAAHGQTGPAVIRRHYLAAGAEQYGKQHAALRVITGCRR